MQIDVNNIWRKYKPNVTMMMKYTTSLIKLNRGTLINEGLYQSLAAY